MMLRTRNLATFLLVVIGILICTEVNAFQAPSSAIFRSSSATTTSTSLAGLLGRFRKKKDLTREIAEQIQIGSPLPEIDVELASEPMAIAEVFSGEGTHVLVGMPGAYTPTCTQEHLPGLRDAFDQFQNLGVKTIAVMTTNDRFVNEAWAKSAGIIDETKENEEDGPFGETITMLSDGDAALVSALGLAEDMGFGMGVRSKRFAMILEDGLVKHLEIDDGMEECANTSAQRLLQVLMPEVVEQEEELSVGVMGIGFLAAALVVGAYTASMNHGGEAPGAASSPPTIPVIPVGPAVQSFDLLKIYGGAFKM